MPSPQQELQPYEIGWQLPLSVRNTFGSRPCIGDHVGDETKPSASGVGIAVGRTSPGAGSVVL